MRFFFLLLSTLFLSTRATESASATNKVCNTGSAINNVQDPANGCVTFTVGQGTGCEWMCNYCATNLGTNNYYFTGNPPVCTYQTGVSVAGVSVAGVSVAGVSVAGGCVGNPVSGQSYTCCAASE